MEITEISVYKSRKIQVRQYEPYDFGFGAKATLTPKENPLKAYAELEKWVNEKLEMEAMKWDNPDAYLRKKANPNPSIMK